MSSLNPNLSNSEKLRDIEDLFHETNKDIKEEVVEEILKLFENVNSEDYSKITRDF